MSGFDDLDAVIDLSEEAKSARDAVAKALGKDVNESRWTSWIPMWCGGMVAVAIIGLKTAVSLIARIGTPLVVTFLEALTKVRTETTEAQTKISAAVLSEFLATDISPETLTPGKGAEGTIRSANAIGNALHDRLTKEFAPTGAVTPESGAQAARTFSGYAVNFGVQNAMIGTIADAASFHFLEEFRELGVEVAQNLGLGRLQRQALGPLINTLIAEPYRQYLEAKYRPNLLSEQVYVRAFTRGKISAEELRGLLARKGFSERDIQLLIEDINDHLTDADLERLVRFGVMSFEAAVAKITEGGIPKDTAELRLRSRILAQADQQEGTLLGRIVALRIDGWIDEDTFRKFFDRLHLTDEERTLVLARVGIEIENPRRRITFAQLKSGLLSGIVDFSQAEDWLDAEGYSAEDKTTLELELVEALANKKPKKKSAIDVQELKAELNPE